MSTPEAVSASLVDGEAESEGSKPSRSQPVTAGQGAVAECLTLSKPVLVNSLCSGPVQTVGLDRNGTSGLVDGAPFSKQIPNISSEHRSGLFTGFAGTPQRCSMNLRSGASCA